MYQRPALAVTTRGNHLAPRAAGQTRNPQNHKAIAQDHKPLADAAPGRPIQGRGNLTAEKHCQITGTKLDSMSSSDRPSSLTAHNLDRVPGAHKIHPPSSDGDVDTIFGLRAGLDERRETQTDANRKYPPNSYGNVDTIFGPFPALNEWRETQTTANNRNGSFKQGRVDATSLGAHMQSLHSQSSSSSLLLASAFTPRPPQESGSHSHTNILKMTGPEKRQYINSIQPETKQNAFSKEASLAHRRCDISGCGEHTVGPNRRSRGTLRKHKVSTPAECQSWCHTYNPWAETKVLVVQLNELIKLPDFDNDVDLIRDMATVDRKMLFHDEALLATMNKWVDARAIEMQRVGALQLWVPAFEYLPQSILVVHVQFVSFPQWALRVVEEVVWEMFRKAYRNTRGQVLFYVGDVNLSELVGRPR